MGERIDLVAISTNPSGRRKKPLDEDVALEELADHTDGYTGAGIASLSSAAVMLIL
jgi:SpoVK/Ycf46/Vps4 family AAA+-type ATPase